MRSITFAAAAALAIIGTPAESKDRRFVQKEVFKPDETAWAAASGTASLKGSAVLRTRGGEIRTCAGLKVLLIPVSAYSKERMIHQFGETERGLQLDRSAPFASTDPAYLKSMRTAVCDAQGAFIFDSLPTGSFYVVATVTWGAPSRFGILLPQGGELLEQVVLEPGARKEIVLGA